MALNQCHSCGEVHDPRSPHRWMRARFRRGTRRLRRLLRHT